MLDKLKNIKWGYILVGILLLAIGICFILFNNSLTALTVIIGVILGIFGIVLSVITISEKERGFYFFTKIIFSVICIAAGIITAIFNQSSAAYLVSVFCLFLIIDASFKLNTAAMSKRFSVGGWWVMMIVSVLVIGSSFFLLSFTPQSIETSSIILGIIFIVDAVTNLFSTYWVAVYEERQKAEFYYEFHCELYQRDE